MNDGTTTRMLLTTAVFAAVAALMAVPANAVLLDVEGGGAGSAAATPAPTIEPGTIPYLSQGIGVDETLFSGQTDRLDTAIKTAMDARAVAQAAVQQSDVGPIPYLSHGIGVDESQFSGQRSLGLTGDSPLTRVDRSVSAAPQGTSSGNDFDWTWVGLGAGLAALLAVGMAGLLFSARHRGRVALP